MYDQINWENRLFGLSLSGAYRLEISVDQRERERVSRRFSQIKDLADLRRRRPERSRRIRISANQRAAQSALISEKEGFTQIFAD